MFIFILGIKHNSVLANDYNIVITENPVSQMFTDNQLVMARVKAEGNGLKYRWEYRFSWENDWKNWEGTGKDSAETSFNFPASFNGLVLRCVVSDGNGNEVVSESATYVLYKKDEWELPIS